MQPQNDHGYSIIDYSMIGKLKGEMAEWSNAAVLKTVVPLREPGVRIPLSPRLKCEIGCGGQINT